MKAKTSEACCEGHECRHRRKHGILPGVILVILGTIFLLNNYGFTNFDIGKLWPLFLIIPGIFIILGKTKE